MIIQIEVKGTHLKLLLDFKVLVGGILVAVDLHVGYMTLLRSSRLVYFDETLQSNTTVTNTKNIT